MRSGKHKKANSTIPSGYSRGVRLSSKETEMNAKKIIQTLRINKMDHLNYNPSYSNKLWRGHFQELFDAQNQNCNIEEEFAEKL